MRKYFNNKHGDMDMIMGAVVVSITLAVSIAIVWSVVSAIDSPGLDDRIRENIYGLQEINDNDAANATWNATTYANNSTESFTASLESFYTVAPIVLIVLAAIGILGYVMMLRRR